MKRLNAAHAGLARDPAGRSRRQMRALGRHFRIRLRKGRFNEQQVGIPNEADNGRAIGRRVGGARRFSAQQIE